MTYEEALAALRHRGTGKGMDRRVIASKTELQRVVNADGGPHLVDLVLCDKHILTWKPGGNIALTTRGWWNQMTIDRYNRYLPYGFRVVQDRLFWFVKTPSGTRPFKDGMELRPDGKVVALCDQLNCIDATELLVKVRAYAKTYTKELVAGRIPRDGGSRLMNHDCGICAATVRILRGGHIEAAVTHYLEHVLEHAPDSSLPPSLVLVPAHHVHAVSRCFDSDGRGGVMTRQFMYDLIECSWTESQVLIRKPRSKKKLVEQTEAVMTTLNMPRTDIQPRAHARNIRMMLEDWLLDMFGFQIQPGYENIYNIQR
jgi:hypothetical protein